MMMQMKNNRARTRELNQRKIIKIVSKYIPVRNEPSRFGLVVCQLQKSFIVQVISEVVVDDIPWMQINSGWICSRDSSGALCFITSTDVEANKFWAIEYDNRRRISAAVGQMLTKSYSLTNARRISRYLETQSNKYVKHVKPLTNLPDVSIEDLLIALQTSTGLASSEIFEFMKVAASQQSDPPKTLVNIATEVNETMNLRPSLWVKNDMHILETVDITIKNDTFIMLCAKGDIKGYEAAINQGQELAAVHSELKYTALHAAVDFGAKEIVERLLSAGVSPNVRDARFGKTALHFAAQSGRNEIASLLLEKGADRTIAAYNGVLPYELADENGHVMCREILKQVPPEIRQAHITQATDTTISLTWENPKIYPQIHALIDEYMVIHEPVDAARFGNGTTYTTRERHLTVRNLLPSTGHGFVILSHSVAGWSSQSEKLIHFTLPSAPCAPPPMELLKVTKNGIVLAWHPPELDNGGAVDLYQIEMTDQNVMIMESQSMTSVDDSEEANSLDESTGMIFDDAESVASSNSNSVSDGFFDVQKKGTKTLHDLHRKGSGMLDQSSWHRLIKHRDVTVFSKYVMGLESYHNYYFRLSCRNEFGWSQWGQWNGPFTPQEGVFVKQQGYGWVKLGWTEPQLVLGRKVNKYELQMCQISGAMSTKIQVFGGSKSTRKNATVGNNFDTVDDKLTTSEFVVNNLKPGKKYQFRVRPMIEGAWFGWEMGLMSDIISMKSAAPDVPHSVKISQWISDEIPISIRNTQTSEDPETVEEDEAGDDSEANFVSRNNLAVTHNSIDIEWINGVPNGSKVIECQVQCAKVREYLIDDLDKAKLACGKEESYDEFIYQTNSEDSLNWVDITKQGEFLSAQSFRVKKLLSGACYTFRVRQRNEIHWSSFSKASPLCTTLLAAPPQAPEIIQISTCFAIAQWRPSRSATFELSSLNYEVKISECPIECIDDVNAINLFELRWRLATVRPIKTDSGLGSLDICDRVLIDDLVAMTTYVIKVRIETVAGWSMWSDLSEPFRTLALP